MLFFTDGGMKPGEYICDCCGNSYQTEKSRDNHINKGCYARETGQFKLSNKNELFDSQKCCPRNPFCLYGDTETEMKQHIENMGPDDDWDEIHFHRQYSSTLSLTIHKFFKCSIFLCTKKVQGTECMKNAADEHFLLFENEDENGMSLKYVKETKYDINPSDEQNQKYKEGKFCWGEYTFANTFFENDEDEDETLM